MIFLYILCGILGLILLIAAFLGICALTVDTKTEYNTYSPFLRRVCIISIGIVHKLLRIKTHPTGMEKLPKGRFLMVGNHRSMFDPVVSFYVFRNHYLGFISKPSNFKIPFYGRIVRRCCFIPIDRENPRNALKTINRASEIIGSDTASMAVYPEGTRSKTGELLEFHNGIFKIAQKAGVPIVVVAIDGTEKIHENFPKKRSDVFFDVIDVIPAEEVKALKSDEIGSRVKTALLEKLGK